MKNGAIWLDSDKKLINARGGGILAFNGRYYWYGEHKRAGKTGYLALDGVHCYESGDLKHWDDRGIVLAVSDDPTSPIVSGCRIERPKVIFNAKTGKFVMYFHSTDEWHRLAKRGLAVADSPTGPFSFLGASRVNAGFWPINISPEDKADNSEIPPESEFSNGESQEVRQYRIYARDRMQGQMARDITLFVDDDNKAYHIYSSEHNSTLHIAEFTDDYLDWTGRYVRVFPNRWNEGAAMFKYNKKYYLLSSGCSGWAPNTARAGVADHIFGPWKELPNPCRGINPENNLGPEKTFGGQSTFVLPAGDRRIAMFDLWNSETFSDSRYCWLDIHLTESGYEIPWKDDFQF